jgi:phosphosulfolactate synthase
MVLVEGAELVDKGRPRSAFIRALKKGLDFSRVLIELPGHWVSGTSLCNIHDLKKFLVREFGPDVNLANIMPDDVIETESLRVGLGVVGPRLTPTKRPGKRRAGGQK